MSRLYRNHPHYNRIEGLQLRNELIGKAIAFSDEKFGTFYSKIQSIKELDFKTDFGDIDLIILLNTSVQEFVSELRKHFVEVYYCKNSHVVSVLFPVDGKSYHVDYVMAKTEQVFKNFVTYYSNNIILNFFGQFLQLHGVEVGHDGIVYAYEDKRGNVKKIKFEDDLQRFFIDYFNERPWEMSFHTKDEVIDYLGNVHMFPGSEKYLTVHCQDKKLAMKRHGLSNEIYEGLGFEYPGFPDFVFQFYPPHWAMIQQVIAEHEQKLERNRVNREAIERFIEENNIPESFRQETFAVIRPLLEKIQEKGTQ